MSAGVTAAAGPLPCVWLGEQVRYEDALAAQRDLVATHHDGTGGDVVLALTHDRVYTAGRRADVEHHILGTVPGIRVVRTDRGGDVTYHGPGQVVVYPILRLAHPKAARPYVGALEQACVGVAASYGIAAAPDRRRPGVWVETDKLAAVGIRIGGGVTSHGVAFNVATDLADFGGLVPCGIVDGGVTSLQRLGVDTDVDEVRRRLVEELGSALGREVYWAPGGGADRPDMLYSTS